MEYNSRLVISYVCLKVGECGLYTVEVAGKYKPLRNRVSILHRVASYITFVCFYHASTRFTIVINTQTALRKENNFPLHRPSGRKLNSYLLEVMSDDLH